MDYSEQVRAAVSGGPVLKWTLLRTRRAPFRTAYQRLVQAQEIVESGTGAMGDPTYVGLPGASFPERKKKPVHIRKADIKLMMRAGHSEAEARAILGPLVNDFVAYIRALSRAEDDAVRLANDRDAAKWANTVTA